MFRHMQCCMPQTTRTLRNSVCAFSRKNLLINNFKIKMGNQPVTLANLSPLSASMCWPLFVVICALMRRSFCNAASIFICRCASDFLRVTSDSTWSASSFKLSSCQVMNKREGRSIELDTDRNHFKLFNFGQIKHES